MSSCQVACCRFPDSHTTQSHRCGYCGEYGHGQIECGNQAKINALQKFYNDILPEHKWCTHCPNHSFAKKKHVSHAHNCHKCGKRHSESDCTIQELDTYLERFHFMEDVAKFSKQKLEDFGDNIYTTIYTGMGSTLYIRKKHGEILALFMHQDSWGQYGVNADDRPILNKFTNGLQSVDSSNFFDEDNTLESVTVDCPICRTTNQRDKVVKAFGLRDKCSICLEANVDWFFTECGHAVACDDCFRKL